jgi:hypothetical protein
MVPYKKCTIKQHAVIRRELVDLLGLHTPLTQYIILKLVKPAYVSTLPISSWLGASDEDHHRFPPASHYAIHACSRRRAAQRSPKTAP